MNVVRQASSPNSTNPRITMVVADNVLASALADSLTTEGYVVENVDRGDEAVQKLADSPPDLAIVEWMLSGMSGPEICTRLRAEDATRKLPIIMLSSRGEEVLRLRGFSAGADDFVVKPFSMRELIARVHALLRRNRFAVANRLLIRGDLLLDHETRRVRRGLRDVPVNRTGFRLLECLLERPGSVFSRKHLLERVWGPSIEITDRAIDVYIGRLRRVLSVGHERDPILTVPGAGYSFDETFGKPGNTAKFATAEASPTNRSRRGYD
jgi:two-component system, OmpR family, phosphate regulon response regulator PhoB